MKKAVIDYNFHNFQQSFKERVKPIVESAKFFLKELAEEEGGTITPKSPIPTSNGVVKSIEDNGDVVNFGNWLLPIGALDDSAVIAIAQYLYEN